MSGLYDNYNLANSFGSRQDQFRSSSYDFNNFQMPEQNWQQNVGSLGKGIGGLGQFAGGLYGMYLGGEQLKDQKKNNSLYRRLAKEQQTNHNNFVSGVAKGFA